MYKPETFVCYQALARAVLKTYEVDLEHEYKKLLKAKNNLCLRLRDGKSKGLVNRWGGRPVDAWISWSHSFAKYEEILEEEKTDRFKLLEEIAKCAPVTRCQSGTTAQIAKRNY